MAKRRFYHKAKTFSKINLSYLSYCANLAYESKEYIEAELTSLGYDLHRDNFFFSDKDTDTQAFVVGDKNKIILSFRGTEGKIPDWITNIDAFKETWINVPQAGEVHHGFYVALSSIWDEVTSEIKKLRTSGQSIWLTGHSLGGALATLAAATLRLQQPEIEINGLYTFGQPRVGNKEFSSNFNSKLKKKCYRCVNNNDVVTRVPPRIFGYSHVGRLMYFDVDGVLHRDNSLSWWARFWDQLEGRFDDVFNLAPDGVGDHSMDIYQELSEGI